MMVYKRVHTIRHGTAIITILVTLIVSAAALIGYISFRNGKEAVKDLANQTLEVIQIRVSQNLDHFLATPHGLNALNARAFQTGLVDLRDFIGLRKRFLHQIQAFDTVETCAFGLETGEFIGAGRWGYSGFNSAIADKAVDNAYRLYVLDEKGELGRLISRVPDYSPQTRPWYRAAVQAGGPAWSPVYIWASQTNIGISAVLPVYAEDGKLLGVQQAALSLSHIGKFLESIKVGHTGLIYIVERSGLLVASSVPGALVRKDPSNPDAPAERIEAMRSDNVLIEAATRYLMEKFGNFEAISGRERLTVMIEGETHFLNVASYSDNRGLDWLVVIVIPESDLMGALYSNMRATVVIGFFGVLGAIFIGVWMTRRVTQPIRKLGDAAMDMSRGKWGKIEGDIRIEEVRQLTDSFNKMAEELHRSFVTLEDRVQERTKELEDASRRLEKEIVERKRMEAALRESELFLNATGRMARVGGWEVNAETRELIWTEQTYDLYGVPFGEKPDLETMIRSVHSDDQNRLAVGMERALAYGEPFDMEVRFVSGAGENLWVRITCGPEVAEGGKFRVRGTIQDITDRKRVEEERLRLERQIQQIHKSESLGRMAGAIAHNFNNLLGIIIGNLDLAMLDLRAGTRVRKAVEEGMLGAKRAAEISRLMLTYLGHTTAGKNLVDLAKICRDAVALMRASMPEAVSLYTEIPDPGPLVNADAAQIEQVVTNLVQNAVEAIGREKGRITVSLDQIGVDKLRGLRIYPPEWKPGAEQYACLSVFDTGCGIDVENMEKLFDPFFTTKFIGRGLGLAVVLGVVKAHEGAIAVESEPGRGAVFRILLPIMDVEKN